MQRIHQLQAPISAIFAASSFHIRAVTPRPNAYLRSCFSFAPRLCLNITKRSTLSHLLYSQVQLPALGTFLTLSNYPCHKIPAAPPKSRCLPLHSIPTCTPTPPVCLRSPSLTRPISPVSPQLGTTQHGLLTQGPSSLPLPCSLSHEGLVVALQYSSVVAEPHCGGKAGL